MQAGRRKEAEACFRTAAATHMTPHALNNWAMCRYADGDHGAVLRILTPILGSAAPLPYTRALASLAQAALGRQEAARDLLDAAIRDLDAGLARPAARGEVPEPAWVEYTLLSKQAAGALGEHRLVLDLHGRWPGRDLPQGAFFAGVAAFNLGKYAVASKHWRQITHRDWRRLADGYALVADRADQGLVPPFALEYDPGDERQEQSKTPEAARALAAKGAVRARFLALMFAEETEHAMAMTESLISETGDWGVDLGRRLLAGATVPMGLKMGAAKALTDIGIFAPDQPIPIVHQGRPTSILLKRMDVRDEDPELDRVVAQAIRLRDAGNKDEAYRILSDLQAKGIAYPPAMGTLANLMRDRGELEQARGLLESLERLAPENPAVLFNLAGFWLQKGNLERARQYAERIDPAGEVPAFRERLAALKAHLRQPELITQLPSVDSIGDSMRQEVEKKPISQGISLAAALKQIPVQWLNAAAALHRVAPTKRRPERERALAGVLKDPARLREALQAEEPQVRAALRLLLENEGWSKLQVLTRRFGAQDGDGFWWDEQPPASPVGRLRLLGLVYVGRTHVDGKAHKVAVVPADLRGALAAAL